MNHTKSTVMQQEIEELYLRDSQDFDFIPQQVKWYVKNLETWKNTADKPEECEHVAEQENDESSSQSSISQYSHNRESKKHHKIHNKCGFKFDGAPFAPPSRVARETNYNWVQPKWNNNPDNPNKIEIAMNNDCPQEGISYNSFNDEKPKNFKRNDQFSYEKNHALSINYSGSNLSIKKSVESCVKSIKNAKMLPFPRSSEILGIHIKKSNRTLHKSINKNRPIDMSGLRSKEVPTRPKSDEFLPSVESLFGLDKCESLSTKLGPTYRNPSIINNPAFRIVHEKSPSNKSEMFRKFAGKF